LWIVQRAFGGAIRVTLKEDRKIFHPRCGLSVLLFTFLQIFHPFQGFNTNIHPSAGSPLAPGSFPWRKNGKNADDLCDGIGLGMLSKNSPSKRRILKEDIPDNKAFFSCARGCAKSHLKWPEAFWLLLRFKSNKEN